MTHPNKIKGNNYERELVNEAKERGLDARRAYASDGRALGHGEKVDLEVAGWRLQAKRTKKLAQKYQIPDDADAVVVRQDRGESVVIMKWSDFLELYDSEFVE